MRPILTDDQVHPSIRDKVDGYLKEERDALLSAIDEHDVVVVGMGQNPVVKSVRKLLDKMDVPYHYIGHGSYVSGYRHRLVYKMLTGWVTFPMVFVKGVFVGGFSDVKKLCDEGEFRKLLDG